MSAGPGGKDGSMAAQGHDDMLEHLDIERVPDRGQSLGTLDIGRARRRIAAWMIVDQDDGGGVEFDRAAEDRARIDGKLTERSVLQLLVRDEAVRGVEEQDAQHFVAERAHR